MGGEKTPEQKKVAMVCFWACVAVALIGFIVPVQTIDSGTVRRSYTLFDLITGRGPSQAEVRIREAADPYPR